MKLKTVIMSKSGKVPIKFKKGAGLAGLYGPPAKKRAVIGFKGALAAGKVK